MKMELIFIPKIDITLYEVDAEKNNQFKIQIKSSICKMVIVIIAVIPS